MQTGDKRKRAGYYSPSGRGRPVPACITTAARTGGQAVGHKSWDFRTRTGERFPLAHEPTLFHDRVMKTRYWVGSIIFIALSALAARAEDWPQFRGPTGQGLSTDQRLPLEWTSTNNVAWKQSIPGKGWSSPCYVDGRLYLTTADSPAGGGLNLRALCLDAASGGILWNTEVFALDGSKAGRIHGKNSQASPTPLIEGDRVYVHFGHHGTACLDRRGKVVWRNDALPYPPVHGGGGSAIIVEDALVFSCDGASDPFLVALNKHDGKVLWKVPRPTHAKKQFSFTTPLAITVKGRTQIISPGSGVVCAYAPEDGRELWRVRYGEGYSVIPRPVFAHGLVFVSSGFDAPKAFAIRPDGAGDVTDTHIAWSTTKGAPNTPSMLAVGDELYMVSDAGVATCLDARTGQVHWNERVSGPCSASPIHAGGRIYIQDEEGVGTVIKAGKQFEKLATNPLGERTLASYAVGPGALFIRGEKHLFCIRGQAETHGSASRQPVPGKRKS